MKSNLRVLVRYFVNLDSAWTHYATVLTGLSFFLLVVNFFGIRNLVDCGWMEIVFSLVLPMLIWIAFMVLLRGVRLPYANLYGVLGALYCICMIIHGLSYENIFQILFAVIWYCLTALICLGTTGGFIANRAYMAWAFLLPVIYRILFVDLGRYILKLDILSFMPEAAALSGLTVFGFFAFALNARTIKRKNIYLR